MSQINWKDTLFIYLAWSIPAIIIVVSIWYENKGIKIIGTIITILMLLVLSIAEVHGYEDQ